MVDYLINQIVVTNNNAKELMMKIETLKDLLKWTQATHQNLSECMMHCSEHYENERGVMLLDYLAGHENVLTTVLQGFADTSSANVLNTWCLEYLDRQPITAHGHCDSPFVGMDLSKIIATVVSQHNQIISLYKHLHAKADIPSMEILLKQLIDLEEHHVMQMVQGAKRMEDI